MGMREEGCRASDMAAVGLVDVAELHGRDVWAHLPMEVRGQQAGRANQEGDGHEGRCAAIARAYMLMLLLLLDCYNSPICEKIQCTKIFVSIEPSILQGLDQIDDVL